MNHPKQLILLMFALLGCARLAMAQDKPTTQPTIWTLGSLQSIGGTVPEVWGSPVVVTPPDFPGIRFNGSSDGIVLAVNPLKGWSQFTVEAMIKPESGGLEEQRFMHLEDKNQNRCMMEIRLIDKSWALDTFLLSGQSQRPLLDRTKLHPADKWTWVALVYGNGHMASYINGEKELEGDVNVTPMVDGKISLGVRQNKVYWYKGIIREMRFHPAALTPGQLQHP
jgi:hypothetical protein